MVCCSLTFPAEVYGSVQAYLVACSFLMGLLNFALTPWVQNGLAGDYLVVLLICRRRYLSCTSSWDSFATTKHRVTLRRETEQGKPSVN